MNKKRINELFYKEKKYSEIKEIISKSSESWSFNICGKIALYEKNTDEAFEYFDKANNIYGCAYSEFLAGKTEDAIILLNLISNSSSIANWLLFFIGLTENNLGYSTYFQVRNFYEQDLEMLFMYKQHEKIGAIIQQTGYIANFNREVYKYCARVMLNNGCTKQAEIMLRDSLNICYNDPETHYLMGEVNIIKNNMQEAIYQFETAASVNKGYYPAEEKIKQLKTTGKKV